MPNYKWLNKSYRLKSGNWIPEIHLCEETPGGMEVFRLLAPEGRQFSTEQVVADYCEIMVSKWIKLK